MTQICFYLVGCDVFISLSVFTICVISDSVTLAKTEECVLKHTVTLRNSIFLISLCVQVCVCVCFQLIFSTRSLSRITDMNLIHWKQCVYFIVLSLSSKHTHTHTRYQTCSANIVLLLDTELESEFPGTSMSVTGCGHV